MNKKFLKLAFIGLAASFCLSAQASPGGQEEVAMAKCSKDTNGSVQRQRGCGSYDNDDGNQNSCTTSTCKPRNNKNQKKSAAQKVVQGS